MTTTILALIELGAILLLLMLGWGAAGAVVLAGITYISSSGIIAKVLGDLGRLGNRETPVVLSILVFEDLAMAVYLPLMTVLIGGLSLATGAQTVGMSLVVVSVVLLVALRDLFAALFFVFFVLFGMNIDPRTLPPVLGWALLLAVVTALTKLLTGYWAARSAGIGVAGRWRAGAALTIRGEFSIVIAGLAVTSGAVARHAVKTV